MALMKRLTGVWLAVLLCTITASAQVVLVPEVQAGGVIMKQQLWSFVVNNLTGASMQATAHITVTDRVSGQTLVETSSGVLLLPSGTKRITYQEQSPLNYGIVSLGFAADRPMNQPLPVGEYQVCYRLLDRSAKNLLLAFECVKIQAEPLSPPQLIQPEDKTVILEPRPLLTWTPPAPVHMFTALGYEVKVAPLYKGQSPQEAMQRNIPVLVQPATQNALAYPASFTNLEAGKTYVWQVQATDAGRPAGQSDVWSFTVIPDSVVRIVSAAPFVKADGSVSSTAVMHQGFLKLEYISTTTDSLLRINIAPQGVRKRKGFSSYTQEVSIRPGVNFLTVNLNGKLKLDEGLIYEVNVATPRGREQRLHFQQYNYLR